MDDDPARLLALETILEPLGDRLVRVASADEALRQLRTHRFVTVLVDVRMGGADGFEVARRIGTGQGSAPVPMILVAPTDGGGAQAARGYAVGAADFLTVPSDAGLLRSRVAALADIHRQNQRALERERSRREGEIDALEERHRAAMRESESRLMQVVESAISAVVMVDEDGTVTTFNAAAEEMFGRRAGEVCGGPVTLLFVEELSPGVLGDHVGRRSGMVQLTGRRAGGEPFPVEATVSRLPFTDLATFTIIVRDVSLQRRAEEALRTQAASLAATTAELTELNTALQQRQAELQHAMNARNRFYASMSHELRTPINAIIGYGTLLLDDIYGPLNERQRQGLVRSHRAALHLLELVNDVLDLSKIEAGKIELSLQPVSFPALIEDLFVTVGPLADEHGSPLTLESSCAVTVVSDPRRVRQVLLNLLSNAIKFGHDRPILVRCAAWGEGGVEIQVRDEGPGIARADLARIFDEFVQLPENGLDGHGTGLGLAISRRLARLLGGALSAESAVGSGSTFSLRLPSDVDDFGGSRPELDGQPGSVGALPMLPHRAATARPC